MECQAPCDVFNRMKGKKKYSYISLPPSIVKIKKAGKAIRVSLGDGDQAWAVLRGHLCHSPWGLGKILTRVGFFARAFISISQKVLCGEAVWQKTRAPRP